MTTINPKTTCDYCEVVKPLRNAQKSQWWHLSNYFGLNGLLCGKCYSLVSHDAFKKPENPEGLKKVKAKLLEKKNGR